MESYLKALILIVAVAVSLLSSKVAHGGLPAKLALERAFPPSRRVGLEELRARDRLRHGRLLQGRVFGVVDFPVEGSYNPFTVGLYFTRVKLGTPPKEFYVQIDTGSDILWVACSPCDGCPRSSGLPIRLNSFSLQGSPTASRVTCSDEICTSAAQTGQAGCSSQSPNSQCNYKFEYGDGSGTSGYYVSDTLSFDTVVGDDSTVNSSTSIVFGCSNTQTGELTKPERAVDGIFGFGQHDLSVISQLSSRGVAPKVFSHCLKGSDNGGGILVLGKIIEPGIVYTPLVQSQPHYNLNLQSIAVNGKILSIDPSVFATTSNRGTIVDSGTTLAYLAEEAYDPFINAINAAVLQSARDYPSKGNRCYLISNSVDEIFPSVTLNFQGGASMILKPEDYLLQHGSADGAAIWCIGWQKIQGQGITILGDLVLKDKIFVYDLAHHRIGWVNYDCSLSVNVSASGRRESLNTGQLSESSSSSQFYYKMTPTNIVVCLVYIIVVFRFSCL
ncbi:aspartic proteinase-like protein 2 [Cinnamomum micranthum f. kanehirae]|uniref:Aspartic proteinase-like protein 2 n=1 Tax=Cinnamomum micranthum f. kanehirae TaxID=337451 RepID=A0A443PNA5_9MAGN|nr:aspartic proteinase-like protein 2 [Cinnamomum micranthum f. kanehirae]